MAGYYFSLPQITQLTIPQQAALNETKPIALSGGPGTGKSVVSLWRHISNYRQGKKSLLLTFTTTLTSYLKSCCESLNTNASVNVKTAYKGKPRKGSHWDEIIIDEAQDLPIAYYSDIKSIAKVTYGADDSQILYPDKCSKQSDLREIFGSNVEYVLDKNFRSTQRIMLFAKNAFPDAYIPAATISGLSSNVGEKPTMLISGLNEWNDSEGKYSISNTKQNDSIIQIINTFKSDTHNIAILVPFKNYVLAFETILKDNNIDDFSIYYEDDERFPNGAEKIKNIHITTLKSAKGLEFDTVIIPNFNKYTQICGRFNIKWEDYYVGVTRARSNLYLICELGMSQFDSVTDKSIL
jgi:DNA helicase IV